MDEQSIWRTATKATSTVQVIVHIIMDQQQEEAPPPEPLVILRGPVLVTVAVFSIGISMLQCLSFLSIVQLSVVLVGVSLCCYDAARIGQEQLRGFLRRQLENTVWDEALYKFFHPDYEWYKFFTETMIGQAWIYILPLTSSQRVRLLQASLGITEEEARAILFQPGGYKHMLLPESFLNWLEGERKIGALDMSICSENNTDEYAEVVTVHEDADSTSSSEARPSLTAVSPRSIVDGGEYHVRYPSRVGQELEIAEQQSSASHQQRNRQTTQPKRYCGRQPTINTMKKEEVPPSLSATITSIFLEYVVQGNLSPAMQYLLDSQHIQTVGIAAAAALTLQLRFSPRARNILMGTLEASSVVGLSAISLGAASLLFAKKTLPTGQLRVNERNLYSYISRVMQWRKSLVGILSSGNETSGNTRRIKAALCAAVAIFLMEWKRRRRQRLHFDASSGRR